MSKYTVQKKQNLTDIAVQNYGSSWADGLIKMVEYNGVSLAQSLDEVTDLEVTEVNENNLSLKYLQERNVAVVTGEYVNSNDSDWILATGSWRDEGFWRDDENWID